MSEAEVRRLHERPEDIELAAVVRFFPEYTCEHPLWLDDGYPVLDDLRLPDALVQRLRQWADYWNTTYGWDDGWPVNTPAAWWVAEETALPQDLALALGQDFTVRADGHYLRSTSAAQAPAAAAAIGALQRATEEETKRIKTELLSGATYTVWSGDSPYQPHPTADEPDQARATD